MISVFVSIPIHGRFSRAIEKSQKLKVFGMGYWVVLVRMTPRANQRQAEQGSTQAFHPIEIVLGLKLSRDGATFGSGRVHADKTGCNLLIKRWIGEQVTRKLPSNKLIERKVVVEGPDNPIAIGKNPSPVIQVQTMGVPVTDCIQPIPGLMLAIIGTSKKRIHKPFIRVFASVFQKRFESGWIRRQPGQSERNPSRQGFPLRLRSKFKSFFLQLCLNVMINGVSLHLPF